MTDTEFRHAVPCFCAIPCSTNCRPMLFILHSGSLSGDARAIAENTCRSVKGELGLTNSDILMIFNNLLGRVITDATLRRKMAGKSDFNASEIVALALILEMTPRDVLECFHLYPNM